MEDVNISSVLRQGWKTAHEGLEGSACGPEPTTVFKIHHEGRHADNEEVNRRRVVDEISSLQTWLAPGSDDVGC